METCEFHCDYEISDEFYCTVCDQEGNSFRVLRDRINKTDVINGFLVYDDSHGHCTLCGYLTCRGSCFK